jgi:hypothetical protein
MKKTVMKMPVNVAKQVDPAEAWVQNRAADTGATVTALKPPIEPLKRLTIDIPASFHTRIKTQCAARGVKMVDVVRELLEKEFPEGQGA